MVKDIGADEMYCDEDVLPLTHGRHRSPVAAQRHSWPRLTKVGRDPSWLITVAHPPSPSPLIYRQTLSFSDALMSLVS